MQALSQLSYSPTRPAECYISNGAKLRDHRRLRQGGAERSIRKRTQGPFPGPWCSPCLPSYALRPAGPRPSPTGGPLRLASAFFVAASRRDLLGACDAPPEQEPGLRGYASADGDDDRVARFSSNGGRTPRMHDQSARAGPRLVRLTIRPTAHRCRHHAPSRAARGKGDAERLAESYRGRA